MLGRRRVGERLRRSHAVHRLLLDPVHRRRHRDPRDVEDGRRDVDDVRELRAEPAGVGDARRPVDHHRVPRAAQVRADLLAPLERGVAGPGPRRAVVRIHHLAAPGLHAAVALGELQLHLVGQRDPVLHRQLVERTGDRPLHAGAVVAPDPDDQGVVQLAELLDRVDHPADVVVGVLREPRVHLHLAGVERLQLLGHVVPCRERLVARRQLGVRGDHAQLLLPREGLLPQPVPPLVELALVLVRPGLRHVMRGVAAAGGEVDEERLLRVLGPHAVQPLDRLVGHRVRQVVGVLLVVELRRRPDDLLVLRQARVPLAGPAAEEAVEVVEPPAVRPAVQRPGRALLPVGRQVPLAERRGAVPVVPQDARQRRAVARKGRRVPGEPARELTDRAEADRVAVPPGQQRRPRRRAQRGDVEPVVPQARPRRCACSSACRSARRTCSGCRTPHRRSAPAARSGRHPAASGDRSGSSPAPNRRASCWPPPGTRPGGSAASCGQARSSSPTSLLSTGPKACRSC